MQAEIQGPLFIWRWGTAIRLVPQRVLASNTNKKRYISFCGTFGYIASIFQPAQNWVDFPKLGRDEIGVTDPTCTKNKQVITELAKTFARFGVRDRMVIAPASCPPWCASVLMRPSPRIREDFLHNATTARMRRFSPICD